MRKLLFFATIFLLLSFTDQSDEKDKTRKKNKAKVEVSVDKTDQNAKETKEEEATEIASPAAKPIETNIPKLNRIDSLRNLSHTLLTSMRQQTGGQPLVIDHVNDFISQLIADTLPDHENQQLEMCQQLTNDLRTLRLSDNTVLNQLRVFIRQRKAINEAHEVLSNPYNINKIQRASKSLTQIKEEGQLSEHLTKKTDRLIKGLNYYERKVVLRRINDLAEELLALNFAATATTDSINSCETDKEVNTDSLFHCAIDHEGRNILIAFVPYADNLRSKMVEAFTLDDQGHVDINHTDWKKIEAVKQEVESVLNK